MPGKNAFNAAIVITSMLVVTIMLNPEISRAAKRSATLPVEHPQGVFFPLNTSYCQAAVSDGSTLWVSCFGDVKAVFAVEAATGKQLGRIDFGRDFPGGIVLDGSHLWVQSGTNAGFYLNKIDIASRKVIARLRYGEKGGAAVGFDGVHVWVTNDSTAFRVDTKTCTVEAMVSLPANSYIKSMAFDGKCIWLLDSVNGNLFRIDPMSAQITGKLVVSPARRMNSMAFDGAYLWVGGSRGKIVYKIDPRTVRIVKTINGDDGGGVAFDGRNVWVSHHIKEQRLTRIDPKSDRISAINELMIDIYNLLPVSGRLWIVSPGGLFRMPSGK